jgi:hypothetical protein
MFNFIENFILEAYNVVKTTLHSLYKYFFEELEL